MEAVAAGFTFAQPAKKSLASKCPYCDLVLRHPSKIQAHLRTHTDERPYACNMCSLRFRTLHPLKVHIRRAHTGALNFLLETISGYFGFRMKNFRKILLFVVVFRGSEIFAYQIGDC